MSKPPYWAYNDTVCFIDGHGWGVSPTLRTVYLGTEEEVHEMMANSTGSGEKPSNQNLAVLKGIKSGNTKHG